MDFFEKIGEKITSTSKDVAKKTKELADISKINTQISSEEDSIKYKYNQIGKLYYETFGENPDEVFAPMCQSIIESQKKISEYRYQIQVIKGVKRCSGCGGDAPNDSIFCPVCGNKMTLEEDVIIDPVVELKCPNCDKPLVEGMQFCTGCGNKLD